LLVFRQGYRNVAYGNFFINGSGGIRLKAGDTDFVYNNYFATGTGDALVLQFEAAFPLDKVTIAHNTFVDCGVLKLTTPGPTNIVIANNIFKKSSGSIVDGTTGAITFTGNIIHGSFGIPVPAGNTVVDPQLALNSDGYYGLSSTSPAIDSANPDYPAILDVPDIDDDPSILLDISGQSRPADRPLKDVGCDEYGAGGITNRPLTLSDVGPGYLRVTSVEGEASIPGSFRLMQNYPNPFNPATTIHYTLPRSSHVSLKVFDTLGKEVAALVNEQKPAGNHRATLNAANGKMSSGVYFYRLQADEYTSTNKMILLK